VHPVGSYCTKVNIFWTFTKSESK